MTDREIAKQILLNCVVIVKNLNNDKIWALHDVIQKITERDKMPHHYNFNDVNIDVLLSIDMMSDKVGSANIMYTGFEWINHFFKLIPSKNNWNNTGTLILTHQQLKIINKFYEDNLNTKESLEKLLSSIDFKECLNNREEILCQIMK